MSNKMEKVVERCTIKQAIAHSLYKVYKKMHPDKNEEELFVQFYYDMQKKKESP